MGFLTGKKLLITGVISNRSIAYGIAEACHREGAELAFTYSDERFAERLKGFAAQFGSDIVLPMDVTKDDQIAAVVETLTEKWGGLDGFVHSIGYAPRESIAGDFLEGFSRDAFHTALDISTYSYPALAKAFLPMMKAALDASTRYLAQSLGREGIRANAISAGPIKTLAASGIKGFSKLLRVMEKNAPLGRTVTIQEVGNTAAFLLSDLASGITGNICYVDAGFHAVAVADVED